MPSNTGSAKFSQPSVLNALKTRACGVCVWKVAKLFIGPPPNLFAVSMIILPSSCAAYLVIVSSITLPGRAITTMSLSTSASAAEPIVTLVPSSARSACALSLSGLFTPNEILCPAAAHFRQASRQCFLLQEQQYEVHSLSFL